MSDQESKKAEEQHRSSIKPDEELDESTFKTYPGNCHCGKFRFQITLPKINKLNECNCSICYMNGLRGLVWFPIGGLRKFEVVEGDEDKDLSSYSFGRGYLKHKFCKECGTNLFARHGDLIGINALSLEPMPEIEAIPLDITPNTEKKGNAKFREPFYAPQHGEPVKWTKDDEPLKEGNVEYQGHCHCGSIRYVLRYKPMSEWEPSDCNCSHCFKSGANNIYPPTSAVQYHPDNEKNSTKYTIIHADMRAVFCKTCGTDVSLTGDKLPIAILNVRTIEDPKEEGSMLDHEKVGKRCKLKKYDQRSKEPKYEGRRHKIIETKI